ncbi:family 43 glycosylhydrolase [Actinotalea sp. JY-7876]|uniref:family 43 glycosylhydrolase n=2 Tax=unclassified Actinotalea TaxID=2638618 RepID=UPI0015F63E67|nr:family 43 glycosylhydrolase [Actinotalea sp. JY-7876]
MTQSTSLSVVGRVAAAGLLVVGLALTTTPAAAGGGGGGGHGGGGHGGGGHGGGGHGGGGPGSGADATGTEYTNPVSAPFADTFADPAVIRGLDGWWYAYGTTDPLREGEGTRHLLPISRSTDLVTWEYVGDAFTEATLPAWADASRGAALWAPDIRYVDGEYRLYYVVTETTVTGEPNDNAIGVATAPSPAGPWTDSGDPVVDPRNNGGEGNYLWTFDPHHVVGPDGVEHLFYGSYYGGIWVTELDETGTEAVGEPVQVAVDNKYEGAYVVQHDGLWYLFASSANCCAGPTTGYSVHVGRSESITGPYVDREGVPLLQSRAGGTPVLAPNGNTWVGTGHNALVTDLAGQDWIVYHAIDRTDPYLDGTDGINERPMLIDRLDWVDGWPTVRAGAWASDDVQPGPVTGGRAVTSFDQGIRAPWQGSAWRAADDAQSGRHAVARRAGELITRHALPGDVRVEADVRLDGAVAGGVVTGFREGRGGWSWGWRGTDAQGAGAQGVEAQGGAEAQRGRGGGPGGREPEQVAAWVDAASGELVVEVRRPGRDARATAPVAPGTGLATWHSIALEVSGGVATAELSQARLGDPLAVVRLELPRGTRTAGSAGALAGGAGVHVDNLSAVPLAAPVTERVPLPATGPVVDAAEFDDGLGEGWTALRDPAVTVEGGELVWQVEPTDLTGPGGTAGLLLREVPDGDWTAETRVTVDLGIDEVRNYQQAGIIAYADDDLFARLSHVAIWNTRQTEFGYEIPYEGRTQYGGTIVGPPSDTTWLRLVHRTDDAGEREVQALTSTDGVTWVAGGVWTFPVGTDVRVGLLAHGNQGGDPATARFDYLRITAD